MKGVKKKEIKSPNKEIVQANKILPTFLNFPVLNSSAVGFYVKNQVNQGK